MKIMKYLWQWLLVIVCVVSLLVLVVLVLVQVSDQFIVIFSYWVGLYGINGQLYYGGYVDYFNYINFKEGGVNGVKLFWEECEIEYNNVKGVECYECMKNKNLVIYGIVINFMVIGIFYVFIDKIVEDKVLLVMIGYGCIDVVDGLVFLYVFLLVIIYQMQVLVIVKYLVGKNNGLLVGKKIVFLYYDLVYGKEFIVVLQVEFFIGKFKLVEILVVYFGNEQGVQWLCICQENLDYVIFWGWGVMNQIVLKVVQKVGYLCDKIVGFWWVGLEEDIIFVGDVVKGYLLVIWNVVGKDVFVIVDIDKVVYGVGKGNMQDKNKFGFIFYNCGVLVVIVMVEVVCMVQDKYGKGKVMSGEQVCWGFENFNIIDVCLKVLGVIGLLFEIKILCDNYEGLGKVKIQ